MQHIYFLQQKNFTLLSVRETEVSYRQILTRSRYVHAQNPRAPVLVKLVSQTLLSEVEVK